MLINIIAKTIPSWILQIFADLEETINNSTQIYTLCLALFLTFNVNFPKIGEKISLCILYMDRA